MLTIFEAVENVEKMEKKADTKKKKLSRRKFLEWAVKEIVFLKRMSRTMFLG